jgi:hypothetical protein
MPTVAHFTYSPTFLPTMILTHIYNYPTSRKTTCSFSHLIIYPTAFMLTWTNTDCPIREYWRGKYHCTIDLLFDLLGLACFANKNKNFQLSYTWFQTSQTGGQWYSDTSPFSIPWSYRCFWLFCAPLQLPTCPPAYKTTPQKGHETPQMCG